MASKSSGQPNPRLLPYNRQEFLHDSVLGSHETIKPSPPQGVDLLTPLPSEVLIKIFAWLPPDCFFHLGHVSKHFRKFMQENAATICNTSIRLLFPKQVSMLQCELVDGWLVPMLPQLFMLELQLKTKFLKSALHSDCWQFRTSLSSPGPNLLYMLHHGLLAPSHSMRSGGPGAAGITSVHLGEQMFLQLSLKDMFEINGVDWRGVAGVGKEGFTGSRMMSLVWYYGVPL